MGVDLTVVHGVQKVYYIHIYVWYSTALCISYGWPWLYPDPSELNGAWGRPAWLRIPDAQDDLHDALQLGTVDAVPGVSCWSLNGVLEKNGSKTKDIRRSCCGIPNPADTLGFVLCIKTSNWRQASSMILKRCFTDLSSPIFTDAKIETTKKWWILLHF